jgi:prepilin-type N-terminal cleavage/methylation domain-containing protein
MLTTFKRTKERLRRQRGDEGFTLIELLIVIIILAILATIVIFAVGTTTKNAALASCKSTVKTVQTALEAFKAQTPTGKYPAALATLAKTVKTGTTTKGPWLKSAPHTATVTKYGWVFTSYSKTTGTFTVLTKGTKTAKPTSSTTVCKGA